MKNNNKIWGLMMIVMAAIVIIGQLQVMPLGLSSITLILIIFFSITLLKSLLSLEYPGIFFSIAFLWMLLETPLQLVHFSLWSILLTAGLLSMGFSILFPKKYKTKNDGYDAYRDEFQTGEHQSTYQYNQDHFVYCYNRFGSATKYISMTELEKAKLCNSFGEMKVYLDQATMKGLETTIEVDNMFGNLQIFIPKEWTVDEDVTAFAGEVSTKNHYYQDGKLIVHLVGRVRFGEVSIIYV